MKFITEDDLRLAYKSVPFTSYVIMPQERLTPGGRQFLIDRQIRICDSNPPDPGEAGPGRKEDIRLSGADCKISSDTAAFIRTVQALLLQTGSDLSKVFCSVFQSSLRKFLKWMLFSQIVVIPF